MRTAISINDLTKKYGNTSALSNLNITIESNKIYGLIGRNGAGKTTLMHLLAGQLLPTTGSIHIFGEQIYENTKALKQICFFSPFSYASNYIKTFKISDFIDNALLFYPNWDKNFAKQLIDLFSLDLKKPFNNLSTGMISMISIVISLASRANITLLDEPYNGLDAAARQEFYEILAEDYSNNPRTIIFSTHLIDEASNLFEDVILLHNGKLLLQESMSSIEESSYIITGNQENIDCLVNKKIIDRKQLGNTVICAIFDNVSEREKTEWIHAGLEIRNLPLQQLFIHLTTNSGR